MIKVIGNRYKSVILNDIRKYQNESLVFAYDTEMLNMPQTYWLDSSSNSIEKLIDGIEYNIGDMRFQYVIVYTNMREKDMKEIEIYLRELEERGVCVCSILMCKE